MPGSLVAPDQVVLTPVRSVTSTPFVINRNNR